MKNGHEEHLKEYHRFECDGRKFVYDVNDLLIFEVDQVVWDFYDATERGEAVEADHLPATGHTAQDISEAVEELRAMRLLVPAAEQPKPPSPPRPKGYQGITLNVTHGCNLRCTYCFASQGDYGLGASKMSVETAETAIDWLLEQNGERESANVTFFGGEPMMNMRTIVETVDLANQRSAATGKHISYQMTTNGTLLSRENVDIIADKEIDVLVSMDGSRETNDKFRLFPSGRGSHDAVVKGVQRLKTATGKAALRGTISPGETEFSESARHMIEDVGATGVVFEPAADNPMHGASIRPEDMDAIKAEWEKVADYFLDHARHGELLPVGNLLKLLQQIDSRKKAVYGCTAGWGNVAVDPTGDIYPCHRFVGESDWKMGNVKEATLDQSIRDQFAENHVDNREPCKSCWVRYTCGGRCAHEAKQATGRISDPDPVRCDLVRHMTELALKVYVRLKPYESSLVTSRS
jgi:uncharacterized protein